ncbi:MAG: SCO family protein [Sulfuricella sp.]|nr:SCO family protein [Sulfuricella sp.]
MNKTLTGFALVLALILAWVAFAPGTSRSPTAPAGTPKGGDFTLASSDGAVSLHDFRGKVVLLYFGYTSCPDICPTSLGFTSQALASLDKAELEKVRMLFVTVDPLRDTLDKLKTYTAYFHPAIVGLSGTPQQIAQVTKSYGASYGRQETGSAGGYVVDHSAFTYVIAPDGSLFQTLDHGTPPAQVVEAIRAAMKRK